MKRKPLAGSLVGNTVAGANLVPLSTQAAIAENTPVQIEFSGGKLTDQGDGTDAIMDLGPTKPNANFDLLTVPKIPDFLPVKIGEDLITIKPTLAKSESITVGGVCRIKEGWHVAGEVVNANNGTDTLDGQITFEMTPYYAIFNESTNSYGGFNTLNGMNITNDPTTPSFNGTSLKIGGDAMILINTPLGKGQGTRSSRLDSLMLDVTTSMQQLKKGACTGNVIWSLIAGPAV